MTERDSADGWATSAERLLADAARAAQGARERLSSALVELFLPDDVRLSDHQRFTMERLLGALVATAEEEFRERAIEALGSAGTPELRAALGTARVQIALPALDRALVLRDADLVSELLRRAEEHRLGSALAFSAEGDRAAGPPLLERLMASGRAAIADAAMALLIAESRRFDSFGDPLLARTDLPAELQHRLVWWIAAAVRDYVIVRHHIDPVATDRALVIAATGMLAGYDEGETLENRAWALAGLLQTEGAIGDELLEQALAEGRLALFSAAIALRAGIDGGSAWEMLTDPDGSRLAVLLRAIECGRDQAAGILLRLALVDGRDESGLGDRMDAYEALTADQAAAAIRPWRLDADYRRAIAGLAAGGQSR